MHEERVAREEGVADLVGQTRRGVSRRRNGLDLEAARLKRLAVRDELVELTAIGGEIVAQIEYAFEHLLHRRDVLANASLCIEALLDHLRSG